MRADEVISRALERIRQRWYAQRPRTFWRDRRQLLAALTWPAAQLEALHVDMRVPQYGAMLDGLLGGIEQHAEPRVAGEYFPAYLMRCVRTHWQHHWEDYYDAGKRLRGTYDRLLARAGVRAGAEGADTAKVLAAAHALVAPASRPTRPRPQKDPQLDLFGPPA